LSGSLEPCDPPSPTDETAVECADGTQSKPVSEEPPVDFPATEDSLNELIIAPVKLAATSLISSRRLSVSNQMFGEGLIL
jgi:hypothetical protein